MITLEPVTVKSAMVFKAVRLRALQDSPRAFSSTYARELQLPDEEWIARTSRWNGEKAILYLAMDRDAPCGIAGVMRDEDQPSVALLISMWTAPTHRKSGVGRMLVNQVLAWCRTREVCTLRLLVTSGNDGAERFYERLGFSRTGRTEPYPVDPTMVEHEMSRPVGDS